MPAHDRMHRRSSSAQNDIECQLETLRGCGKSYTSICDAAVIACLCTESYRGDGGVQRLQGRHENASVLGREGCGPLLAEQTRLMYSWTLAPFFDAGNVYVRRR